MNNERTPANNNSSNNRKNQKQQREDIDLQQAENKEVEDTNNNSIHNVTFAYCTPQTKIRKFDSASLFRQRLLALQKQKNQEEGGKKQTNNNDGNENKILLHHQPQIDLQEDAAAVDGDEKNKNRASSSVPRAQVIPKALTIQGHQEDEGHLEEDEHRQLVLLSSAVRNNKNNQQVSILKATVTSSVQKNKKVVVLPGIFSSSSKKKFQNSNSSAVRLGQDGIIQQTQQNEDEDEEHRTGFPPSSSAKKKKNNKNADSDDDEDYFQNNNNNNDIDSLSPLSSSASEDEEDFDDEDDMFLPEQDEVDFALLSEEEKEQRRQEKEELRRRRSFERMEKKEKRLRKKEQLKRRSKSIKQSTMMMMKDGEDNDGEGEDEENEESQDEENQNRDVELNEDYSQQDPTRSKRRQQSNHIDVTFTIEEPLNIIEEEGASEEEITIKNQENLHNKAREVQISCPFEAELLDAAQPKKKILFDSNQNDNQKKQPEKNRFNSLPLVPNFNDDDYDNDNNNQQEQNQTNKNNNNHNIFANLLSNTQQTPLASLVVPVGSNLSTTTTTTTTKNNNNNNLALNQQLGHLPLPPASPMPEAQPVLSLEQQRQHDQMIKQRNELVDALQRKQQQKQQLSVLNSTNNNSSNLNLTSQNNSTTTYWTVNSKGERVMLETGLTSKLFLTPNEKFAASSSLLLVTENADTGATGIKNKKQQDAETAADSANFFSLLLSSSAKKQNNFNNSSMNNNNGDKSVHFHLVPTASPLVTTLLANRHVAVPPALPSPKIRASFVRVVYVDFENCILRRGLVVCRPWMIDTFDEAVTERLRFSFQVNNNNNNQQQPRRREQTTSSAAASPQNNFQGNNNNNVIETTTLRFIGDVVAVVQKQWKTPQLIACSMDRAVVNRVLGLDEELATTTTTNSKNESTFVASSPFTVNFQNNLVQWSGKPSDLSRPALYLQKAPCFDFYQQQQEKINVENNLTTTQQQQKLEQDFSSPLVVAAAGNKNSLKTAEKQQQTQKILSVTSPCPQSGLLLNEFEEQSSHQRKDSSNKNGKTKHRENKRDDAEAEVGDDDDADKNAPTSTQEEENFKKLAHGAKLFYFVTPITATYYIPSLGPPKKLDKVTPAALTTAQNNIKKSNKNNINSDANNNNQQLKDDYQFALQMHQNSIWNNNNNNNNINNNNENSSKNVIKNQKNGEDDDGDDDDEERKNNNIANNNLNNESQSDFAQLATTSASCVERNKPVMVLSCPPVVALTEGQAMNILSFCHDKKLIRQLRDEKMKARQRKLRQMMATSSHSKNQHQREENVACAAETNTPSHASKNEKISSSSSHKKDKHHIISHGENDEACFDDDDEEEDEEEDSDDDDDEDEQEYQRIHQENIQDRHEVNKKKRSLLVKHKNFLSDRSVHCWLITNLSVAHHMATSSFINSNNRDNSQVQRSSSHAAYSFLSAGGYSNYFTDSLSTSLGTNVGRYYLTDTKPTFQQLSKHYQGYLNFLRKIQKEKEAGLAAAAAASSRKNMMKNRMRLNNQGKTVGFAEEAENENENISSPLSEHLQNKKKTNIFSEPPPAPPFPQVVDTILLPSLAPGNLVRWWRRTHSVLEGSNNNSNVNNNKNYSRQHEQQQQQHFYYFQTGLAPTCVCKILSIHMVQFASSIDILHNSGDLMNGFTCPRFSLQDIVTGQIWRNLSLWPLDLERLE